jgi:hypothetical protein
MNAGHINVLPDAGFLRTAAKELDGRVYSVRPAE